MCSASSDEAQKTTAGMLVFAIFIQMSRKFFDAACQNSDLHLRRARIGVVALGFADLVGLLSLRKHAERIAYSWLNCKTSRHRWHLGGQALNQYLSPILLSFGRAGCSTCGSCRHFDEFDVKDKGRICRDYDLSGWIFHILRAVSK